MSFISTMSLIMEKLVLAELLLRAPVHFNKFSNLPIKSSFLSFHFCGSVLLSGYRKLPIRRPSSRLDDEKTRGQVIFSARRFPESRSVLDAACAARS